MPVFKLFVFGLNKGKYTVLIKKKETYSSFVVDFVSVSDLVHYEAQRTAAREPREKS